jgi:hypothetical protein
MTVKRGRAGHVSSDEKDPAPPEEPPPPPEDNGGYENPGDTEVRWGPPIEGDYRNPGEMIPQVRKIPSIGRTRKSPTLKVPKGRGFPGI